MELLLLAGELEKTLYDYELCRTQAARMRELREKLEQRSLSVAVIGQFKRGKTTFVNKLIGEDILPTGIIPITAAATRISAGERRVRVVFRNGLKEDIEIEELSSYISEQENHENHLEVSEVLLQTEADFMKQGLEIVDTPGVGSVHEKNSKAAYDYAEKSDAVIFMLSVDSPINQIEISFLEKAKEYAGKFYFCVNKVDTVDEKDLSSYIEYCRSLLERFSGQAEVRLFPISAVTGYGMEELKKALIEDLSAYTEEIIQRSVSLKTAELIRGIKSQISSYRAVLNMAPNVFRSRFEEMSGILEERRSRNRGLIKNETDEQPMLPKSKADRLELLPMAMINEEKLFLKKKAGELFGIDYYCEIESLDYGKEILLEEYIERVESLYIELEKSLNTIFMYKEENAYTVARRIEDINILIRKLEKYRKQVEENEGR